MTEQQNLSPVSPEEELRYFLHTTCVHEHAHRVVAEHFGAAAWIQIERSDSSNPEDKTWLGRCMIDSRALDADEMRIVCLAGAVAEAIDSDPDIASYDISEWLEDGTIELSGTDAAGAYDEGDINRCVELVRNLWPVITTAASFEADNRDLGPLPLVMEQRVSGC